MDRTASTSCGQVVETVQQSWTVCGDSVDEARKTWNHQTGPTTLSSEDPHRCSHDSLPLHPVSMGVDGLTLTE